MMWGTHTGDGVVRATVRVREAAPSDWDDIAEITFQAFLHGVIGHRHMTPEREGPMRDVAGRAGSGRIFVAEVGPTRRLVGAVSVLRAGTPYCHLALPDEAEIRMLSVVPDARGHGIARALMVHCLTADARPGVAAAVLDTDPSNAASQGLYRSLGFERIADREYLPAPTGGLLRAYRRELGVPLPPSAGAAHPARASGAAPGSRRQKRRRDN